MRIPQTPLDDRGPLRVMFVVTSMPVGGAETLLCNLIARLDRTAFLPELCCLKEKGPLAETLRDTLPIHSELLAGKYDPRILWRLTRLFRQRRIDAVVTVGAGDKMFWGRLAAWRAGVPVICSALHSTGWPDSVGRLNRRLTRLTDAFIGVARPHGDHLVKREGFPRSKVFVIPNGVDTERFAPIADTARIRGSLDIPPAAPLVGIVAALRPEKNHEMFLDVARRVRARVADAHFMIVGDGPIRSQLERVAAELGVAEATRFVGTRHDIPPLLAAMNVFALTSHNEANPVSILEAMSMTCPVVATNVGSVHEMVRDGETGFLVAAGDAGQFADRVVEVLDDTLLARRLGDAGREAVIRHGSLETMVRGYEQLIQALYQSKCEIPGRATRSDDALPTARASGPDPGS